MALCWLGWGAAAAGRSLRWGQRPWVGRSYAANHPGDGAAPQAGIQLRLNFAEQDEATQAAWLKEATCMIGPPPNGRVDAAFLEGAPNLGLVAMGSVGYECPPLRSPTSPLPPLASLFPISPPHLLPSVCPQANRRGRLR